MVRPKEYSDYEALQVGATDTLEQATINDMETQRQQDRQTSSAGTGQSVPHPHNPAASHRPVGKGNSSARRNPGAPSHASPASSATQPHAWQLALWEPEKIKPLQCCLLLGNARTSCTACQRPANHHQICSSHKHQTLWGNVTWPGCAAPMH